MGHTVNAEKCWLSALVAIDQIINESPPDNQRLTHNFLV